ncbi:MAG: hypothetical protein BWY63_03577 [Chloroflexi bacterium ADurb.Bin360]|nr:MAG: hypothetical protein BWY63_03577 [Chloroflexi bacterium ADurb.Bin360]
MVAQPTPPAIQHGAHALAGDIVEVQVIEPGQWIKPFYIGNLTLLPIHPPEIHPIILHRMMNEFEIRFRKTLVADGEGNTLLVFWVTTHRARKSRIDFLVRFDAIRRMQVESRAQSFFMYPTQEPWRIREELPIPGVACPTVGRMPVHINDQHIKRNRGRLEIFHQVLEVLIAVCPVTRPPPSQDEARNQGNRAAKLHVLAQGGFVIMPIAKENPVLHASTWNLVIPTCLYPPIIRVEEHVAGIIKERPPRTGKQTLLQRCVAAAVIQRSPRTAQIARVHHPRAPDNALAIESEADTEVFRRERATANLIAQHHSTSIQNEHVIFNR